MIGVTGATGQLGRLVLEGLRAAGQGAHTVALARRPETVTELDGVTSRAFDYERPETLAPALAGIDRLLLISSSEIGRRTAQHAAVIAAAKAAGVGRIVYTSLLRADTSPLSLAEEHVETEAELARSGLPFTILRNGWYTENYTGSLGGALAGGAVIGAAGEGRINSAARADYAAAAVAVLLAGDHAGKVYELAGDEGWTMADLAAELSRQAGRDIPYRDLGEAGYAAALAEFGLDSWLAAAIASWSARAADGALASDDRSLSRLIGRPTTPMAETVRAALAAL